MSAELRHYCRNPRCRSKLPQPTANMHAAFCTRGCFDQYHRHRCIVCDREFERKNDRQQWFCDRRKCKADYRRCPELYRPFDANRPRVPERFSEASETQVNRGFAPAPRCLRAWRWVRAVGEDDDWELIQRAGKRIAAVRQEGLQYWVARPRTIPEFPLEGFEQAKHRAESLALMALPPHGGMPKQPGPHPMLRERDKRI